MRFMGAACFCVCTRLSGIWEEGSAWCHVRFLFCSPCANISICIRKCHFSSRPYFGDQNTLTRLEFPILLGACSRFGRCFPCCSGLLFYATCVARFGFATHTRPKGGLYLTPNSISSCTWQLTTRMGYQILSSFEGYRRSGISSLCCLCAPWH